jgi:hypothetical protein
MAIRFIVLTVQYSCFLRSLLMSCHSAARGYRARNLLFLTLVRLHRLKADSLRDEAALRNDKGLGVVANIKEISRGT